MKHNHKWVRPLEVVGGCDTNPGVMGLGGTWIKVTEVCRRCGRYRVMTGGDTRWEGPEAERRIEYLDADEVSRRYVERERELELELEKWAAERAVEAAQQRRPL